MSFYRFSPISNAETFNEAIAYIALTLDTMSEQLFQTSLPVTTLKLFAHYPDEYKYLLTLITQMGAPAPFSSETSLYVQLNKEIHGHLIQYLGVRVIDPYRLQVGCGDYEIPDFADFKLKWLRTSPWIREFSNDILEIWHPDFDVLGYIVQPLT